MFRKGGGCFRFDYARPNLPAHCLYNKRANINVNDLRWGIPKVLLIFLSLLLLLWLFLFLFFSLLSFPFWLFIKSDARKRNLKLLYRTT